MRLAERPAPALMTVLAADAIVLASLHPEPLCDAMRAQRLSIIERMAALPEATRSATYAHVLIHLDASTVRPWSLPDRACVFGRSRLDCASQRVFVALEDTAEPPPGGNRSCPPAPDARGRRRRLTRPLRPQGRPGACGCPRHDSGTSPSVGCASFFSAVRRFRRPTPQMRSLRRRHAPARISRPGFQTNRACPHH